MTKNLIFTENIDMDWNLLLSTQRLGQESRGGEDHHNRTEFQRDYDRIIFSSPFRRMQNKTQVFPLPGSIFVHNRLTHSLEVASVGRSLGNMVAEKADQQKLGISNPLFLEIGAVVSAACLSHDMGNPPFGHSGENAISQFFLKGAGQSLKSELSAGQWADFTQFDGNANAFRILSHQLNGRRPGGFSLTYTMMATIIKYPHESELTNKPKFGFFQSDKENYRKIAEHLQIKQIQANPMKFVRHPLVFLVEAADDICYQLMDLEDAHKLKILSFDQTKELFLNFFKGTENEKKLTRIEETLRLVDDPNEQIAYLRASVIGKLASECVRVFFDKHDQILTGNFQRTLIESIDPVSLEATRIIRDLSYKKIYNDRSVVEVELAGYKIIGTLLEEFTDAVLHPEENFSKKLLLLVPDQYRGIQETTYEKVQSVIDFVSGMTDVYALDLYRKIKGINLPVIG